MATSNFRQTIEGLFTAFASREPALRRSYVFGATCIAFGAGAAIGAVVTELTRAYSLSIPVVLLAMVLSRCGRRPSPS
jgi:uncharacterized membrane protein YoaK (UPF0700 family)